MAGQDRVIVKKIEGIQPERFEIIMMSDDFSAVLHRSEPVGEKKVREALLRAGMTEAEASLRIEQSRRHPNTQRPT